MVFAILKWPIRKGCNRHWQVAFGTFHEKEIVYFKRLKGPWDYVAKCKRFLGSLYSLLEFENVNIHFFYQQHQGLIYAHFFEIQSRTGFRLQFPHFTRCSYVLILLDPFY